MSRAGSMDNLNASFKRMNSFTHHSEGDEDDVQVYVCMCILCMNMCVCVCVYVWLV